MNLRVFGLKLNQLCFLIGGLGILVSLPWFSAGGFWLWLLSQLLIVFGVIFVLLNK